MAAKISVLVVNWNGRSLLKACLDSLVRQTYGCTEVIFVDNGSSDQSGDFVRAEFPSVTVVSSSENRGFSGGNLEGLKVAQGEFVALVNNDARLDKQCIMNLVEPMFNNRNIGICASKLIFEDRSEINAAGDGITTAAVGFNRGMGAGPLSFNAQEPVFGACGAVVLYRRQMFDEIGFLDEDFFLYDEDTDLNFRAQLAGWECIYVPTAVAYHKGNATAGKLTDTHVYYHTRNLEFVWIKNMPLNLMLRFAHHKIIQEFGSFCYLCLRHGKWRAYFRAKRDALKMMPLMLRKRREVQSRRRVSNEYLRQLMTSIFSTSMIRQKFFQFLKG